MENILQDPINVVFSSSGSFSSLQWKGFLIEERTHLDLGTASS